jgi:hypothetical protein
MPAAEIIQGALNVPAGATATVTGPDIVNTGASGVKVVAVTTAIGTGSITVSIQGKDPASGTYYTILAGTAITTNTTNVYTVFPGGPVAANVSANDSLPAVWRILVTANNANAATYTVGFSTVD